MMRYLRVFNFLWRAKRIEYCLANMWREQTAQHRSLQTITGETCLLIRVVVTCIWPNSYIAINDFQYATLKSWE